MSRLDALTPDQRAVVADLETSFCVTSGAGCGKTRVLVERYIQFLEADPDLPLERLAAITFTENAAAQMRDRIRRACRDQVAAARAAGDAHRVQTWRRRYWDVDVAPIDTIHSFCSALLRRYPIEAGLDPNFALLDEAQAAFLIEDVLAEFFEARLAAADADLLRVLEHFRPDAAREIVAGLMDDQREPLRRTAVPTLARSDDEILRLVRQAADEHARTVLERALAQQNVTDALMRLQAAGGRPGDRIEDARRAALEAVARLRAARTADIARAAADAVAAIDLRGGSKKAWPSADDLAAAKEDLKTVREAVKKARKQAVDVDDDAERAHLAVARSLLAVALAAGEAYAAAKRAQSALDFEDLQTLARDLLVGQPRVLDACRKRFRAILVDELQDTNHLQYEIVRLLTDDPAPRRGPPAPRRGALFAVGDPKQSIYRFRGAEVEVFQEARGHVGDAGRRGLAESFRLHPGTASLVNHVFSRVMGDAYEPIRGRRAQQNADVGELRIVVPPDPSIELRASEGLGAEAAMLAARIAQVVADGSVRVRDRDSGDARPARYGDVAILLRRTTYLHLYEEALERRGVPYHVVAGRGFYKQQEVLDVLHLLRVLDDPSDELHVAGVLRSPFFAVTDEGLFRLRRAGPDLFAALAQAGGLPDLDAEDRRGLARAAAALPAWVAAKDRLGLGALVDAVVFDSGYAASAVGRFGGQRAYANLRQMAELARQFERRGLVGLGEFVDYVTDFMQSEMRMEQAPTEAPGADTVRIMTIHKAKGLEFPVVALPDLGFESGNHAGRCMLSPLTGLAAALRDEEGGSSPSAALALARAAAADADAEEALRLLYVAMTRAEDYLLLTACTNYNPAEDSWMGVLMEAIGANLDVGDRRLALPDGAALALAVHPPARDRTDRRARRVGPRNVFQAGRVAWDRLRERGGASVSAEAARALAQTSPPPAAHAPPLRITATALETYRHCPRRCWWSVVMGVDQPRPPDADDGRLSPLAWGSLCHRALELAEDDRPATLSLAAEGALREAPPLPPEARAGIRGELARTLADFWTGPLGRRVAAAGRVHREMPFVLALGRTEVRGTMDLLFCDAQGQWELVDYKSGSPSGPEADEQAARYELQLGLYALAAGRWIGSPISRWTVYFLGSGAAATRDVTPAALDAARTTAQDLLAAIGSLRYDSAAKGDCTRCAFETLCH